jgi:hypothetical protein
VTRGRTHALTVPVLVVVWVLAVMAGLGRLWAYASTPGAAADAPVEWPHDATSARASGVPTLLVFAHPQCACSEATVSELAILMAHVSHPVNVQVWMYRPAAFSEGWERGDLWTAAARIPGVHVTTDLDGREARRFGAKVSGETMLFDGQGVLRFHGGITDARGHQGDNLGRATLTTLLNGGRVVADKTSVFGCLIHNAES